MCLNRKTKREFNKKVKDIQLVLLKYVVSSDCFRDKITKHKNLVFRVYRYKHDDSSRNTKKLNKHEKNRKFYRALIQDVCIALCTYEGSYSAANSIGRKFLYDSRGLDVISLLVKYYVLCSVSNGRRNRESEFYCEISFGGDFSIAPPIRNTANSLQI